MKKLTYVVTAVALALTGVNADTTNLKGFYGGADIEVGTGKHEVTVNGTVLNESDTVSTTGYGIHAGYEVTDNINLEASYGQLKLENEDSSRLGLDVIYKMNNISNTLKPYVGMGVSKNDLSGTNQDDGYGIRMRLGLFYELMPKVDVGVELNGNYISWKTATDAWGREFGINTTYYGLGFNLNYKF